MNSAPGRFPCDNCGKVYRWYRNLTTHRKIECGKDPNIVCPYCPRRTKHRNSMRSHIRRIHKSIIQVTAISTQACSSPKTPLFPIVRPRLHVCPRCGQMYSWASNLRKHLKMGCGMVTSETQFSCRFCPYRSRVEASFIKHLMSVHQIK
ncbi:zinc finger protein 775-like [Copidosoma floridanum]|uniref:zinc finger protein 775-like n=1 Tax=Copidosoma floridanum TaxID=29053 RepID=UPI000C6FADC9|nr:zinc finger protein 775-like [Copidosoma floridanum]